MIVGYGLGIREENILKFIECEERRFITLYPFV